MRVTKLESAIMSKELYENEPWFDRRSKHEFIRKIHKELILWTSRFIYRYREVPFDYNREEPMVSHFALAADRAKIFALQEYPASPFRADLFARYEDEGKQYECVIEFKKADARLQQTYFPTDINNGIKIYDEAWEQVSRYALRVAGYQCALVGIKVLADMSHGSLNPRTWTYWTEAQNRNEYYRLFRRLCSNLESTIKRVRSERQQEAPNFFWGYTLKHRLAVREREKIASQGGMEVPVGMLWLGRVSRSQFIDGNKSAN